MGESDPEGRAIVGTGNPEFRLRPLIELQMQMSSRQHEMGVGSSSGCSGVGEKLEIISRQLVLNAQEWMISLGVSIDKEEKEGGGPSPLPSFQELEWTKSRFQRGGLE